MILAEYEGGGPMHGFSTLLESAVRESVVIDQERGEEFVYKRSAELEGRTQDGLRIYRYLLGAK